MKLYCFGESGNAYKCALALTMVDVEWEPVFVDFFNGGARTPEFRAINEMGEVPVLVDGDTVLTQSGVILDYISSKTGKLGGEKLVMDLKNGGLKIVRNSSYDLPADVRAAGDKAIEDIKRGAITVNP